MEMSRNLRVALLALTILCYCSAMAGLLLKSFLGLWANGFAFGGVNGLFVLAIHSVQETGLKSKN